MSRFSLGSQSQWNGNKEASGRAAEPRYAGPSLAWPTITWLSAGTKGAGANRKGRVFIRKERKKRVKSGMKTQKKKRPTVWGEVENMRKRRRRRPTRPQTSTAVLKLNEMEGRSVGKAARRHEELYTSEEGTQAK